MKYFKFLFAFAFFLQAFVSQSQSLKLGKDIDINNNDSFAGFEILDEQIDKHRLILSGENHNYTNENISIEMKLFRYLVKKKGFKHLIIEQGYSLGQMLNTYIATGDTFILRKIKNCSFRSFYSFTKNLRTLNLSLPDSQKFSVHCIDVERFFHPAVGYMSYLLPKNKTIPDELLIHIEGLKSLEAYLMGGNNYQRWNSDKDGGIDYNYYYYSDGSISDEKTINLIIHSFDSLNAIYKNYLGENYNAFEKVINSLRDKNYHQSLSSSAQEIIYREQFIYKKFENLANLYPNDKFYGQFGRCHTTDTSIFAECDWYDVHSFINRVNNSMAFSNPCKGFGIALAYTSYKWEENPKNNIKTYTSEFNPYVKIVQKAQSVIFPIYNDTSNWFLKNRFKYVLVSKVIIPEIVLEQTDSSSEETDETNIKKHLYRYQFMHYGIAYSQLQMDIAGLNSALGNAGFNSSFESFGIHLFQNSKDNAMSKGASFFIILPQKTKFENDTNFSLQGFNLGVQAGYDIVQKSKRIAIMPLVGINYLQLKLIPDVKNPQTSFPFSNTPALDIYKNTAFLISPQLDMRVNPFGSLWIGVKAGYNFDFTNTNWKTAGKLHETGANLNQSGMFFETTLSYGADW